MLNFISALKRMIKKIPETATIKNVRLIPKKLNLLTKIGPKIQVNTTQIIAISLSTLDFPNESRN